MLGSSGQAPCRGACQGFAKSLEKLHLFSKVTFPTLHFFMVITEMSKITAVSHIVSNSDKYLRAEG